MRRLMLFRHAKAEPAQAGMRDFDRALAPKGRNDAPRIGAYMVAHDLMPDLVLCSPARRARETSELAAQAFPVAPKTIYQPPVYGLTADGLLDLARATERAVRTLLIVGHNPALEDLASLLVSAGDLVLRGRLDEKFPTAALAAIEMPVDEWDKVDPGSGTLAQFITPGLLQSAG